MLSIIIFLFVLSWLILVHELGHFLAAKRVKAVVEEFSLGFPPRILSRRIKETVYSVGAIFFGGFVKLKGDDNPDDPEGFLNLPPLKKLFIVLAGVIFNIFLAYFFIVFSLYLGYPYLTEKIFIIGFVDKNSLAAQKLKVGDQILGIIVDGKEYRFKELNEISKFLEPNKGKEVEYLVLRENQLIRERVKIPAGIYLSNFVLKKENFLNSLLLGLIKTYENFIKITAGFLKIVKSLFTKEKVNLEIIGPIGIYNLFDYAKNLGIGYLFYFLSIISLNLAFINLLPIPALDGGRALFIIFEILGKKIDYRWEEIIHRFGLIFLIALMIFISLKDIYKLWLK